MWWAHRPWPITSHPRKGKSFSRTSRRSSPTAFRSSIPSAQNNDPKSSMMSRLLLFGACLWWASVSPVMAQITVTDIAVADAFVRSLDPTHNYGGAGALAVSGSIATNVLGQQEGLLDSIMQFDVSGAVSAFNSSIGTGRWVIVSATLNLFEQGAPNNTIFNRGVGPFEVRWVGTNSWLEGSGNPNAPTMD